MTSNNFAKCGVLGQIAMPQTKAIDTIKQSELGRIVTYDNDSKKDSKNDK